MDILEKKIDFLLELYNDQWSQARQCEEQRSTIANLILVLATALIALLNRENSLLIISIFLLFLGVFGILISAKLYERYALHTIRARVYRRVIDSLLNGSNKPFEENIKDYIKTFNKGEISKTVDDKEKKIGGIKELYTNRFDSAKTSNKDEDIQKYLDQENFNIDAFDLEKISIEDLNKHAAIIKERELKFRRRLQEFRIKEPVATFRLNWIWYSLYIVMIFFAIVMISVAIYQLVT